MAHSPNVDVDFRDSNLEPVDSARSGYVKQEIAKKIRKCEVVVCLIGNGTAWRDMVDWELNKGVELGRGTCGVRLKGSRGRTPPLLVDVRAPVAGWGDTREIIAVIECAAARRS
jgi:Thoeris protein ThsB, TIR-like domain